MTARTLQQLARLNSSVHWLSPPPESWSRVFTPPTIGALIDEINRLRVTVGEKPSYMSDGSLQEALEEMLGDYEKPISDPISDARMGVLGG